MTNLLLRRLETILAFARANHIRMLIEVDPDYSKVYIYTDKETYKLITKITQAELSQVMALKGISVIMTNEKMYYPNQKPILFVLPRKKGKIHKRFYSPFVPTRKIKKGNLVVYFVSVKRKVEKKVINEVKSMLRGKRQVQEILENLEMTEEYKTNRIGPNKLAIYRY